jgi:hypothetical protein
MLTDVSEVLTASMIRAIIMLIIIVINRNANRLTNLVTGTTILEMQNEDVYNNNSQVGYICE